MKLYDRLQRRAQQWLDDLDRERDASTVHLRGEALEHRLAELEAERQKHLLLLEGLEVLRKQNHPCLLLGVRPRRQLKVPLRAKDLERKRA